MHHDLNVQTLRRLEEASIAATQRVALIAVVGMLIIGVLTTVDVVFFRAILQSPIPGSNEILQTVFAVAIAAVLPSGLAQRSNIHVELLEKWFSPRLGAWLEFLGAFFLLVVVGLLAWRCGVQALQATRFGEITVIYQLPVPPFLWAIALLVAACLPVQLIATLSSFERAVSRGAGPEPSSSATGHGRRARASALAHHAALVIALAVAGTVAAGLIIDRVSPMIAPYPITTALALFALLWILVLLMIPVGVALALVGILGTGLLVGTQKSLGVAGSETVGLITNPDLALIPLFLMMGSFATVSGMSADLYRLAHAAVGSQRGGVAMATVGGCAGFGALTGSSIATAVTIGAVALPEMRRRGYSPALATGCVAAGATLGQLVPPSTVIVLYAILVEQSIGTLYIAILVPAALTVLLYLVAIAVYVRWQPSSAPGRDEFSLRELIGALVRGAGVMAVFIAVIGGIYSGIFTATEAAAVGAALTFLMALVRGKLGRGGVWQVAAETTRSVAMLYVLIIGALLTSFFMGISGLPTFLIESVGNSGLPPIAIILVLVLLYIVLGTVMDSITVMIITAGLVAPIVVNLGYDPIWWGVMMVVLVEMGVVTPPFGVNLFTLKSLSPDVPLPTIYRGVLPFVAADVVKVLVLIAIPGLVLWLPGTAK